MTVSFQDHPELGWTLSRADGEYDLAMNGGGRLVLQFELQDHITSRRVFTTVNNDFVDVDDVAMVAISPDVELVDFQDPITVVEGAMETDLDGSRHNTILFKQGTTATMVHADDSEEVLPSISVRVTEITVGDAGPEAMPLTLPPSSGYTYAVGYDIDEANDAGAKQVRLDPPAISYVENFVGFPVGTPVPGGVVAHDDAVWHPEEDATGVVVQIVGVTMDGRAEFDLDGDGQAEDDAAHLAAGIDDLERTTIAGMYPIGQELWRTPIPHFCDWDLNMGVGPKCDCPPDTSCYCVPNCNPDIDLPTSCGDEATGSIIECHNAQLGERVGLPGTPHFMDYRSRRQAGSGGGQDPNRIELTEMTGEELPDGLLAVYGVLKLGGKVYVEQAANVPHASVEIFYEPVDAYGRALQGPQPAEICVTYDFERTYLSVTPDGGGSPFGYNGNGAEISQVVRGEANAFNAARCVDITIGTWDIADGSAGLGGFTLDVHHAYAPGSGILEKGDGSFRIAAAVDRVVDSPLDDDRPDDIAFDSAGNAYILTHAGTELWRMDVKGNMTQIAGTGVGGYTGDGGAAIAAQISGDYLAVMLDDTVLIGGAGRIRHVDEVGIITTFAGDGTVAPYGQPEYVDREVALVGNISGLAVSEVGDVYFLENRGGSGNSTLRRISPNGKVRTLAGGPVCNDYSVGFEEELKSADFCFRNGRGLAVTADGSVYFGIHPSSGSDIGRIMLLTPTHGIRKMAGGASPPDGVGDGQDRTLVRVRDIWDMAWSERGSVLYFLSRGRNRVRAMYANGIVDRIAGTGSSGFAGDNGPAMLSQIKTAQGLGIAPNDSLYIADRGNDKVRRVRVAMPGYGPDVIPVSSEDASEVYLFDRDGRHLETVDPLTGAVWWAFTYDADGWLETVTDEAGNTTTVQRDVDGNPTAVVGPYGTTTALETTDGYVTKVTDAENQSVEFTYWENPEGFLKTMTTPRGGEYEFNFNFDGFLTSDENPLNDAQTLVRDEDDATDVTTVTRTLPLGEAFTYTLQDDVEGNSTLTTMAPDGAESRLELTPGEAASFAADGSSSLASYSGDSRFGLQSPVVDDVTEELPSGLTRVTQVDRDVVTGAGGPLDVISWTETVDVNGDEATVTFDSVASLITSTTPEGRVGEAELDLLGRVIRSSFGGLHDVEVVYDANGRVETITQGAGLEERQVELFYDVQTGWLESIIDPIGREVHFTRDDVGRVVQQQLPDGEVVTLGYDPDGNVTSVTPAGQPVHGFAYDLLGQTTEYDPPHVPLVPAPETVYEYDENRRPTKVTRPDGKEITYDYDAFGRLFFVTTPEGIYGYDWVVDGDGDGTGQLESIVDPTGTLAYTWDGPLLKSETRDGFYDHTVSWDYDDDFKVVAQHVTGGASVALAYDDDDLLVSVGDEMIQRDPLTGFITSSTVGDTTMTMDWSDFGEPEALGYTWQGNELYSASYTRDALGRISQMVETVDGVTTTWDYAYDLRGRLSQVDKDGVIDGSWSYDANGNRQVTTPGEAVAATYDAQDRMLTFGDLAFTYGENGEVLTKTDTVKNLTTSYQYDVFGNLRRVDLPDGTVVEYEVDARGRRTGKGVDGVWVQGLVYGDQLAPIAETNGAGVVVARFVYGTRAHVPDYVIRGGDVHRLLTDRLGNVVMAVRVTDGAILQRLEVDAWGVTVSDTNPGFQPFGYGGGLVDNDTGLVRLGARDYSPGAGRWTTRDPVRFADSGNVYEYARSSPSTSLDPSGQQSLQEFNIADAAGRLANDPVGGQRTLDAIGTGGAIGGALAAAEVAVWYTAVRGGPPAWAAVGGLSRWVASTPLGLRVLGFITGTGTSASRGCAASSKTLRPEVVRSGGRSGGQVKNLTGPADSVIKGGGERVFVTDGAGRVVLDVTKDRVKPVVPGVGFGDKRAPTSEELGWLKDMFGG